MVEMINTALMRTVMAAGKLRRRLTEERGQDLLEYAMLSGFLAAGLVILGGILLTGADGGAFGSMANGIKNCIDFGSSCNPPGVPGV